MINFLLTILAIPFHVALVGFTLSTTWCWFMVPIFSVGPLSVLQAYGLMLVWTCFDNTYNKDERSQLGVLVANFFRCAIILFIGAVIHAIM